MKAFIELHYAQQSPCEVDPSRTTEEHERRVELLSRIASFLVVALSIFAAARSASYSSPKPIISVAPPPVAVMMESSPAVYTTVVSSSNTKTLHDDTPVIMLVEPSNTMNSTFNVLPFVVSDDSLINENNESSVISSHQLIDKKVFDLDMTRLRNNVIVGNVFVPALLEVGALVLFQSLGLPILTRALNLARKGRWVKVIKRAVGARFFMNRFGKTIGHIFHVCKLAYKKTNASKIVTRTKKVIKHFMHHQHHDHNHHDNEHSEHHDNEYKKHVPAQKVAHS